MTSKAHEFDPRGGAASRTSLTYDAPDAIGKSAARTDTHRGHFAKLVRATKVVEVIEFATTDSELMGAMTITTTL
jgi:hypothetical protein